MNRTSRYRIGIKQARLLRGKRTNQPVNKLLNGSVILHCRCLTCLSGAIEAIPALLAFVRQIEALRRCIRQDQIEPYTIAFRTHQRDLLRTPPVLQARCIKSLYWWIAVLRLPTVDILPAKFVQWIPSAQSPGNADMVPTVHRLRRPLNVVAQIGERSSNRFMMMARPRTHLDSGLAATCSR